MGGGPQALIRFRDTSSFIYNKYLVRCVLGGLFPPTPSILFPLPSFLLVFFFCLSPLI